METPLGKNKDTEVTDELLRKEQELTEATNRIANEYGIKPLTSLYLRLSQLAKVFQPEHLAKLKEMIEFHHDFSSGETNYSFSANSMINMVEEAEGQPEPIQQFWQKMLFMVNCLQDLDSITFDFLN